jgi:hypothetical protein
LLESAAMRHHHWLATLVLFGCSPPDEPALGETTSHVIGTEGVFDFAIDLPWRMEPRPDANGVMRYDKVPITIAILDEDTNVYSQDLLPNPFSWPQRIGRFCGLTITPIFFFDEFEFGASRHFTPQQLSWIEVTGPGDETHTAYWDFDNPIDPHHRVCHPATESCSSLETIYGTSEWHAQLLVDIVDAPGARQVFELVAHVSHDQDDCSGDLIALKNYAEVFFADAPLPRFDDGWLYGDLHYHSQSTDNEGESGYAYRAVATTLATMGVDFVFATDHASDSIQMVDLDPYSPFTAEEFRGLRDLNQRRWDASLRYLHDVGGANTEGAQLAVGRPRVPRVFLGGEVDVMPEITKKPVSDSAADTAWLVPFGNGRTYDLRADNALCDGWVITPCPKLEMFTQFVDVDGNTAFVVHDTQGLKAHAPSRQHLVHLPRFRDQPVGFVGSRTSKYGGATRHAIEDNGVFDEIEAKDGIAFLAHPLSKGGADQGPGFVPYTQYQYDKMFSHRALAGLQLWNEDARVESDTGNFGQRGVELVTLPPSQTISNGGLVPGFTEGEFSFAPVHDVGRWEWTSEHSPAKDLHHGTAQWDKLLRWGLDLDRTLAIDWLPHGDPRRLFMAGGSDAHGDFNYRREGYVSGPTAVTDTAIAKVRNLVEVGAVRGPCSAVNPKCTGVEAHAPGHSQDQVVEALAEGRFAVTDGPALRIIVDRDRDGEIEATDYPMGSIVELFPGERLPIVVEVMSTAEFGNIANIDLYVGVDADPSDCNHPGCGVPADQRSRTYAPTHHGVRAADDPPANDCGPEICKMSDNYWLPASHVRTLLTKTLGPNQTHAKWQVELDPKWFPPDPRAPFTRRLYVRAFAKTVPPCQAETERGTFRLGCAPRFAYSNPVWATVRPPLDPGEECPFSDRALDRDFDGIPDFCDSFPDQAGGGWTRRFGGLQVDTGTASAIDAAGNVYVVGSAKGSGVQLEGTPGTFTMNNVDGVLLKYAPSGQLLEKLVLTGAGTQQIRDIAVTNDAIFLTGVIQGATDALDVFPQVNPPSSDLFVARVATSDLTIEWVRIFDGSGNAQARAIAANQNGMIAIAGDFGGQLHTLFPATVAQGTSDCFVAWLTAAGGVYKAVMFVDGAGGCTARDIVLDAAGRATTAMTYDGAMKASSAIAKTTLGTDTAVIRWSSTFLPVWGTFLGSASVLSPGDASGMTLALGIGPDVFVGGAFTGNLVATGTQWGGTSTTIATSLGSTDGFLAHLDDKGLLLASPLPIVAGTGDEAINALAVDATGRLIVNGEFSSPNVPLNSLVLNREGLWKNSFISWISPAGDILQARRISTVGGFPTWSKMAATSTGDRAAFAFSLAGEGRFDDFRLVKAKGDSDGAVTVQLGPP